jgi:hypothetical protein
MIMSFDVPDHSWGMGVKSSLFYAGWEKKNGKRCGVWWILEFLKNSLVLNPNFLCKGLLYFPTPRWTTYLQISHEARCNSYLSDDTKNELFPCFVRLVILCKAQKERQIRVRPSKSVIRWTKTCLIGIIRLKESIPFFRYYGVGLFISFTGKCISKKKDISWERVH